MISDAKSYHCIIIVASAYPHSIRLGRFETLTLYST